MIQYQRIVKSDLEQMSELTELCFNRKSTPSYYNWKYYENPEGEICGYTAKNKEGNLIGFWGAIPDRYYLNKKEVTIFHVCDTMTHPDYRRKGIFEKLLLLSCDDLRKENKLLLKVFPGEMAYPGYVKKMKWKDFGRISQSFKPILQIRLELLLRKEKAASYRFEHSNVCSEKINPFNKQIFSQFPLIKSRDKTYIDWRLKDPSCTNKILHCYNNENLIGYCIYCIEPNGLLAIKDIYATEINIYRDLFKRIYILCNEKKLKGLYCWSNKGSYFSRILQNNLFIKNPFNFGIMTYPLFFSIFAEINGISSKIIYNKNIWNILPIDYDG